MTRAGSERLSAGVAVLALALALSGCEPEPRDPRIPLSPLMVPLTPIEAPLTIIFSVEVATPGDLRALLEAPEHSSGDRIIAFATYRRDEDFTEAGVLDPVLRVRMGRMSRDSVNVNQAVVVTPEGEILARYVISSVPRSDPYGVCVVTR